MDTLLLLGFITTTCLFVAVPGPSVAFATAQGVKHGTRGLVVTVTGDALGTVVHIAIAASSLTALISLSAIVLPFLQIAGGGFILYMAWQAFVRFRCASEGAALVAGKASFWAGFFACVSNPKAIAFFVALFPTFISPEHSVLVQSLVYGAIFLVLDAISIFMYALLTMHTVKRTTARWLNADSLSAIGLSGVGVAMIVKGFQAIPER